MPVFKPRERKHRKLARQKEERRKNGFEQENGDEQANATQIVPATQSEKDERRRKLKAELTAHQPESKSSSKKRRRLDKYVETKLKKEENQELLKKLAAQKVDTSLLRSSKQLSRVSDTRKEQLQRALKERAAGIKGDYDEILFERRPEVPTPDDEPAEDVDEMSDVVESGKVPAENVPVSQNEVKVGAGLKRPLELDDSGRPVIKRRKRQKKATPAKTRLAFEAAEALLEESDAESEKDADEWHGFDSDNESASQDSDTSEEQDDSGISGDDESSTDDSDETDDVDEDEDGESSGDKPARVSAFKAWADSQRNEAVGFVPSLALEDQEAAKASFKPRAASPDPVAIDLAAAAQPTENAYRPAGAVVVEREAAGQEARLKLPVVQDEQKIMEAIHNNSVTIVCGATGSGKTTQLPQMLLENGYATKGMIGITQPRRVAATSVADRVKHELGKTHGQQVAHQVRFDSNVSRDTKIKFMTDGILLREISQDFALTKYSAIVIDEAHERSVNTDILIGMLSRIVPLRRDLSREDPENYVPLKLIIMSATLRVTDFLMNDRLFRKVKPPIVEAEGRQYQVTEHFARKTQRDYVAEMVRKVARGHKKLPPGDILVFLTGQDDIQTVQKRLKEQLTLESASFQLSNNKFARDKVVNDYMEDDRKGTAEESDSEAEITGLDGDEDDDDAEFAVETDATAASVPRGPLKAQILPLYAALPKAQQDQVFVATPEGSRKIILATNVAETSLTIDGIKYVFDCGRSKEKQYDIETGVQQFVIDWISKASASQRMGRAGRTGPGHCYRLYSSAIYERYFEKHTLPEILRTPIEGTVLQLKNMKVDNVVNFPFPTPPQAEQLAQAERLLKNLGAIDPRTGQVTATGKELINYPVNPRFGKMLLLGRHYNVLPYIIALVAGLAVGDLFIPEPQSAKKDEDEEDSDYEHRSARKLMDAAAQTAAEKRQQAYGRARQALTYKGDTSDAMKVLTAVVAHAHAGVENESAAFCEQHFLREKGMGEVQALRRQLHNLMEAHIKDTEDRSFRSALNPPSDKDVGRIKQIAAAGYIDQVAVRYDLLPGAVSVGRKPQRAIEVAYRTLQASTTDVDRQASMQEQERQKCVFVHSSSPLARLSVTEMPAYVVYSSLSRAAARTVGATQRTRLHPLTPVTQTQLASLAEGTPLLDIGKSIGKIEEVAGGRRQCWVSVALRDPSMAGSTGWPLKAWKVLQARKGKEWENEKVLDRGK
ncbi:Putative helicase, P-loop containing nucleoside triphosphate hydrolase [Septoria linicola]|uniref:RNA helicase n=1 Tax=Septoria linicola TaxID=215465 RepID=A0A9Q9AK34_9PEZI|nr:putative helicase, P-loop containing nucleoside triphosphate hydrolase [Septoria linicola]USW49374.1 Putative helicase, P-loop containing nucleoside triphosphate hydrolase [Septoria linicola]